MRPESAHCQLPDTGQQLRIGTSQLPLTNTERTDHGGYSPEREESGVTVPTRPQHSQRVPLAAEVEQHLHHSDVYQWNQDADSQSKGALDSARLEYKGERGDR